MMDMEEVDEDYVSGLEAVLRAGLGVERAVWRRDVSGGLINRAAVYCTGGRGAAGGGTAGGDMVRGVDGSGIDGGMEGGGEGSDRGADTGGGEDVFVKYARRDNALSMFTSEIHSLDAIQATGTLRVPTPIGVYEHPLGGAVLVLEHMADLSPLKDVWAGLGDGLARMHQHNPRLLADQASSTVHRPADREAAVTAFGSHHNTHYGPRFCVPPAWCHTWQEYYTRMLLQPQLQQIEERTSDADFRELWAELQLVLHKVFQDVHLQPSLVHGDFCVINVGQCGKDAVIFDPCSSYQPWFTDFTIPEMEQNFDAAFYESYHSHVSQEPHYARLMQAQLFFAHCLCYNSVDQSFRTTALRTGKHLLELSNSI